MPAKIDIYGTFGASPGSDTNLNGNAYFTTVDDAASRHSTSPIGKPFGASNTSYSMERYMKFYCTQAPNTSVTNLRIWGEPRPALGVHYFVGTVDAYANPSVNQSTIAVHRIASTYPSFTNSLLVTGTLVNIADESNYFVVQVRVESTASPGIVDSTKTIIHASWDES